MKSGIIAIVLGLTMIMASIALADVPGSINYQGRLADSAGVPLNNVAGEPADGQIDLNFRIFDAETGGTEQWNQTIPDVPVNNGIFSVLLTGLNETVIPATAQVNRWLEVEVQANGVTSILSPRKELSSVPYALRAGSAQSIDGISVNTLTTIFTSVTNVWNYTSNMWLSVSNSITNIQINVGLIQTNVGLLQTNIGLLQTNVGLLQTNVSIITTNISNLWCAIGYVVGKTGCEPYSNIQVAVNAALAAGYGPARPVTVEVKPGRYTNDLVLQAGIHLKAEVEDGLFSVVVVGNHSYNYTGAEDGDLIISGIAFYSPGVTASDPLFRVTGSGYTSLRLNHCVLQATDNGPALRLENTGTKSGRPSNTEMFHSRVRGLKADSTATALIELNSGSLLMDEADIFLTDAADRSFRATTNSSLVLDNAQIRGRIETANQAYLQLTQSAIDSGNQACLVHNSISNAIAFEVYLNSSAGQVVTGVGPFIYNNLGLNSPTQTLATAYGVYPIYTEGASNLIYRAGRPGDWSSLFTTVPTNVSRALDLLARGVTNIQTNIVLIQTNFPFRERDPQVEDGMADNVVPRWWSTNLTGGSIFNLANGRVGIGTASPIRTLDVNGNAIIRGSLDMNGDVVTNVYRIQVLTNRGAGRVLTSDTNGFGTWQALPTPVFEEHDPQVYDFMDQTVVSRWRGTNLTNSVIFSLDNGNVGVGTNTPTYKLHVNGTLSALGRFDFLQSGYDGSISNRSCDITHDGRELKFRIGGDGGNVPINFSMQNDPALFIDGNRNVGIGLRTNVLPAGRLDVRSPTDWYLLGLGVDAGSSTYLRAGNPVNGTVIIGDQQTTRTVIQPNDGNVGMGTYNPTARLHVRQIGVNDRDHGLYVERAGTFVGGVMYVDPDEIVRIGTKSDDATRPYDRDHLLLNPVNSEVGVVGNLNMMSSNDIFNVNRIQVLYGRGANKVLTSDANGYGSWQPLSTVIEDDPQVDNNMLNNSVPRWDLPAKVLRTGTIFDNAGNVGVGTTSPGAKLDVRGDILIPGGNSLRSDSGYDGTLRLNARGSAHFFIDNDNNSAGETFGVYHDADSFNPPLDTLFTINEAGTAYIKGNLGVGKAPADKLDVNGWARVHGLIINTGDQRIEGNWYQWGGWYQPFLALRADDNMTVLVPPPGGFRVTNYQNAGNPPWYGNNLILRNDPDPYHDYHQLYLPYGRLAEFSDGRLKLNQEPLDYGLAEVMQLESIRYKSSDLKLTSKSGGQASQKEKRGSGIGFIAQEVYKVIPEAVAPPDEIRETWCLSYSTLVPVLVNAVQEQQELIEEQKANNVALEGKIRSLEERIAALEQK